MEENRLTQLSDPIFGELAWDESKGAWLGSVPFAKRTVQIILRATTREPTPEEHLALVAHARKQFVKLQQREPELRQKAATSREKSAKAHMGTDARLPWKKWAKGPELESISLYGCGELRYRNFLLIQTRVTICFDEELKFESFQEHLAGIGA